ncbi:TetR/AcrR family transcriptional regulator [Streptomyces tropicalis]|uniref:TetR/AcrR family transcriptional regulator n=1 Tax=Streptomyces tropicalis TaxID=3034234 RepID=A0ABT6A9T7_9ACTN|nr:TetR/AcrR family transcriptional regulator [Streptomyces tropicalis]MDF3301420.1 TetR/AcrR family transcriptional regulator [Streptomyces tropicalis]
MRPTDASYAPGQRPDGTTAHPTRYGELSGGEQDMAERGTARTRVRAGTRTGPSGAAVGSADWWRGRYALRDRRRARPGGLTLDAITATALRIADDEGLDALTMRAVADRLSVRHTSLYRHVASREELLVELVDHMLGEIRLPGPGRGWRAGTESGAREYRRVLLAHRALVPLLPRGQLLGPNALRAREAGLRLLVEAGWPAERAVRIYLTVTHYVVGAVVLDTGGAARTAARRAAMADLFASLPAGRHPLVTAHSALLGGPDGDDEFDFGLRCLLDGIASTREDRP